MLLFWKFLHLKFLAEIIVIFVNISHVVCMKVYWTYFYFYKSVEETVELIKYYNQTDKGVIWPSDIYFFLISIWYDQATFFFFFSDEGFSIFITFSILLLFFIFLMFWKDFLFKWCLTLLLFVVFLDCYQLYWLLFFMWFLVF